MEIPLRTADHSMQPRSLRRVPKVRKGLRIELPVIEMDPPSAPMTRSKSSAISPLPLSSVSEPGTAPITPSDIKAGIQAVATLALDAKGGAPPQVIVQDVEEVIVELYPCCVSLLFCCLRRRKQVKPTITLSPAPAPAPALVPVPPAQA